MTFLPSSPTVEIVEKEDITAMHFGHDDVLTDEAARQHRRVDADLWAADSDHLTLKSGAFLPLRAVLGFDFY